MTDAMIKIVNTIQNLIQEKKTLERQINITRTDLANAQNQYNAEIKQLKEKLERTKDELEQKTDELRSILNEKPN